ncbi:MAG TPA: LysR family transcriptional regulator [Jatrophihabitans sp.]|nr:LysR family transcriptional regulator [Jatrophihabitans sp.]
MPLPDWIPDVPALDLLLSVAELGSVGKAAAAHGITQPSASARLSRLERQLGLALLNRSPAGTTLTPVGDAVVAWAGVVVAAARELGDNVQALKESRQARLRVAASLTIAEYLLPSWLLTLRRVHPGMQVSALVANSHDVCERVRSGQADLGFVEMPVPPEDLTAGVVGSDRLALVAAPTWPAARAGRAVRPVDLVDQPLLLRELGSGTRETFLTALAGSLGGEPVLPHAVELGSTATILATARAGGGIGVVSARAARADVAAGQLVEITVAGFVAERRLHAVWLGRDPGPSRRQLIEVARHSGDYRPQPG